MSDGRAAPGWPPPLPAAADDPPARLGRALLALTAAVVGLVGALLPAMTGQQVGDPDTAVFWIGAALGTIGSVGAGILAARELGRATWPAASATAIAALVLAGLAGLLTLALVFSG